MSAGFEYVGSGSNRNFCFADLLLRQNNTDVTQLSAANWGVIEVKGPWQLSLLEDVSLGDALNHPGYRKAVLCAVQQVITALNRLQCSDVVCARRRFGFGHLQCWQQLMVPLTYVAAVCDCCAYRPTCVLGFVSGHAIAKQVYDCKILFPQADGDAVAEEAPIFAITNYDVTIFCHRKFCNAVDKRIWASPPIPWNGTGLPPRAAWLHFMAVGQQCHDARVKSNLSRDSVPSTPSSGYPLPLDGAHTLQLNAAWRTGYQTKATP